MRRRDGGKILKRRTDRKRKWMRPGPAGGGFTLVELLLALVITSVSLTAIYGVFSVGLRIWRRSTNESRLAFEDGFLCVRGALDIETEKLPAFLGDTRSMEFFTSAARSGASAWPVRRVRCVFEKADTDPWGSVSLEVTPYAGSVPLMDEAAEDVIIDHVYAFNLRYYAGGRWEETWRRQGIPQAVELSVKIGSEDARARRSFDIVVDIPGSVGEKS